MTKVRFGLIGAGLMGARHAENVVAKADARLVAVADVNLGRARGVAAEYGIEQAYEDYAALLADHDIDAVVIATPGQTHPEIVTAAARGGKHIFCEKPLGHDLRSIDKALEEVQSAGVKLQVGFNRRFDADFGRLRQRIAAGEIGDVLTIHVISRDPVAPAATAATPLFLDTTVHDLDMIRFITRDEVKSVYVAAAEASTAGGGDPATAVTVLTLKCGVIATIDNSRLSSHGYDQRLEVFGSKGVISAGNPASRLTQASVTGATDAHAPYLRRYAQSYVDELSAFVRCIQHNEDVVVTGNDGRAAVALALAARESWREGCVVRLN